MEQKIKHYVDFGTVSSSLVYPMDSGKYIYGPKLDENWVKERLRRQFKGPDVRVERIQNKYAVEITTNAGNTILVYNHDGNYWMLFEVK